MKDLFNQLISETIKPLLKAEGYGKKGLNFYKRIDDLILMFNFQNSHGNTFHETSFYINCGIHSTAIDATIGSDELKEPKEYMCYYRQRISSITGRKADDYTITPTTDLKKLASTLTKDVGVVLNLFNTIKTTSDLVDLMIAKNGLSNYEELLEYLLIKKENKKINTYVKTLYHRFDDKTRWPLFEKTMNALLKKYKQHTTIADIINS